MADELDLDIEADIFYLEDYGQYGARLNDEEYLLIDGFRIVYSDPLDVNAVDWEVFERTYGFSEPVKYQYKVMVANDVASFEATLDKALEKFRKDIENDDGFSFHDRALLVRIDGNDMTIELAEII